MSAHANRPSPGTRTGRVWEISDELLRRLGRLPKGREVAEAYVAEGGNRNTAMTQYSSWRAAYLERRVSQDQTSSRGLHDEGGLLTARLSIGANGEIILPVEIRRAMKLDPTGAVAVQVVDGELRMAAPRVALAHARALVRAFDTGNGSPVDELIHERRKEGARE